VLRIKADNLTAVPMGDSGSIEVGDFVLAIGNPFGIGQTVASGIVSALRRTGLGIEGYEDFIQTDASINPGNSGGALVTLDGRLVGVSTAILSKTGASNGIGFAIPIDMARRVMEQLVANGEIRRGRIGVVLKDGPTSSGSRRGGAEVASIEPSSPAALGGLEKGDVIIAIDGKRVETASDVRNIVGSLPIGREVAVRYQRGGAVAETKVKIEPQRSADATGGMRR
jgi:serine protease Do